MIVPILQPRPGAPQQKKKASSADSRLEYLDAARRYLAELAMMAGHAARSDDPREISLALGVLGRAQDKPRSRRADETYQLDCYECHSAIEIPVAPPHRCRYCGAILEVRWSSL